MPITRRKRANPPDQPEDNNHSSAQPEVTPETLATGQTPTVSLDGEHADVQLNDHTGSAYASPTSPQHQPGSNGDRNDNQDHTPPIEGGRRTARGELFRRPPQPPPQGTRHLLQPRDPFRPQHTRSPYHWGIYFTWLIIPATLDRTRRAACYFMVWLKKAKLVDVLVVGIAARSLLPMIAGTPVVKHLVKLVSLFVKFVVYGVLCDDSSTNSF